MTFNPAYPLSLYQVKPSWEYSQSPGEWIQFWIVRTDLLESNLSSNPAPRFLAGLFSTVLDTRCEVKYIAAAQYGVAGMQLRWPADDSSLLNVIYGTPPTPEQPPVLDTGGGGGGDDGDGIEKEPSAMPWVPIAVGAAALLLMGSRR